MADALITPYRGKNEPRLPSTGLLVLNPADIPTMVTRAKEYGLRRHFLFNAQLFSDHRFFLAGPAVGAPMAVLCLEKLIALGARRIVVYGWCGSIHPDLRICDLFLPSSGLSEEGTSQHYSSEKSSDLSLHAALMAALDQAGFQARSGGIWTTDALYRETRQKVEQYAKHGLVAVDMEYTALQAVATYRSVALGAVMLVSDELFSGSWNPGYPQKKFRSLSRQTLDLLVSLLHKALL
jgi:uridine phosphorylase